MKLFGASKIEGNDLVINRKIVKVLNCMEPSEIHWGEVEAQYVVES